MVVPCVSNISPNITIPNTTANAQCRQDIESDTERVSSMIRRRNSWSEGMAVMSASVSEWFYDIRTNGFKPSQPAKVSSSTTAWAAVLSCGGGNRLHARMIVEPAVPAKRIAIVEAAAVPAKFRNNRERITRPKVKR